MSLAGFLLPVGGAYLVYTVAKTGALGSQAKALAGEFTVLLAPVMSGLGLRTTPCPTAEELAAKLGTTVYQVRTAMAQSGKDGCTITLADLSGVPQVPDTVIVGGVASHPNAKGPPATFSNPTGGSGTWGGLTDQQIQAAFLSAAGGDAAKAAADWQKQHDAEVAQRGF